MSYDIPLQTYIHAHTNTHTLSMLSAFGVYINAMNYNHYN